MMKQFAGHLTIILLAAAGAIMLTACQKNDVTDFEVISVYQYGTSTETSDYEIARMEDGVRISYYHGSWEYDDGLEMEGCLKRQYDGSREDYRTILATMNDCGFASWDGFDKTNQYALDGDGFLLTAMINEGQKITARGSNTYPKGYNDFIKCLNELLENGNVFEDDENKSQENELQESK